MSPVPPEIWALVCGELDRPDLRSALFVCRIFRNASSRLLFKQIYLPFDVEGYDYDDDPEDLKSSRRSFEILDHIVATPTFARMVRHIVVHTGRRAAIYEQCMLNKALRFMSQLRTFTWIGNYPRLSHEITTTLARYCPRLQELNDRSDAQASYSPEPGLRSRQLGRLRDLRVLVLPGIDDTTARDPQNPARGTFTKEAREVIQANAAHLRYLVISALIFWDLPLENFSGLQHLGINDAADLQHLPVVFKHCPQLESFGIDVYDGAVYDVLREHPKALPNLASLKLFDNRSRADHMDEDDTCIKSHVEALIGFIRSKAVVLRRLTVGLGECGNKASARALADLVPHLPNITVLGLENFYATNLDEVVHFLDLVPSRVCALNFCVQWLEEPPGDFPNILERGILKLKAHSHLKFLHFSAQEGANPLAAKDVACALPQIEVLGLQRGSIWDIWRPPGPPHLFQWSRRRIRSRTREDFGRSGDDAAWLMQGIMDQDDDF